MRFRQKVSGHQYANNLSLAWLYDAGDKISAYLFYDYRISTYADHCPDGFLVSTVVKDHSLNFVLILDINRVIFRDFHRKL